MGTWSGLRKQIKERWVKPLRKRVDLHYTLYNSKKRHDSEEQPERAFWMTIDGQECLRVGSQGPFLEFSDGKPLGPDEAVQSLKEYLNLSIESALASSNPICRGLAVLDERLGQRRIKELDEDSEEIELVRAFLSLRKEA